MKTQPNSTEPEYNRDFYTPEAKRARFIRTATRRTNVVLNDLRLIGNMANKNLYLYEEKEVIKIFATLKTAIAKSEDKFKTTENKEFRL